ncbi:MAG: PKD domain-containing protein [Thermodesulfobacteriota bacterium]|nr:PKD domain-containing protein [Thermodesulfobacteriota bacterium]
MYNFFKNKLFNVLSGILFFIVIPFYANAGEIIFHDSVDEWGKWSADSGVWDVGTPLAGSVMAKEGSGCAGTQLSGNYLPDTDSHLISPPVNLPVLQHPWEQLVLSFDSWHVYMPRDYGQLRVRVYNTSWGSWITLGEKFQGNSNGWYTCQRDLNRYAGSKIQIGFYHSADSANEDGEDAGWYIDNLTVEKQTVPFLMPEGFEDGFRGWTATRGVWETGFPVSGPGSAYSGSSCAATMMDGLYDPEMDSMLISPPLSLPDVADGEEISLGFWHWFAYEVRDKGMVRIRSWNERSLYWNSWNNIATYEGESGTWSRALVDITRYAGMTVQVAFFHTADSRYEDGESWGWYVDDVKIYPPEGFPPLIQNIEADMESGFSPLTISFTVTAQDMDGSIAYYSWDWDGDGIIDEQTPAASISHEYASPGFYRPNVTVEDDDGASVKSHDLKLTVNNSSHSHSFDYFSLGDWVADPGYRDLEESLTQVEGEEVSISLGEDSSYESLLLFQWVFGVDLEVEPLIVTIRHKAEVYFNDGNSMYSLNILLNPPDGDINFWDDPVSDSSGGPLSSGGDNFLVCFGPNSSYGGRIGVDTFVEGRNLPHASSNWPQEGEWVETSIIVTEDGFHVESSGDQGFERTSFIACDTSGLASIAVGAGDQAYTHLFVDRIQVDGAAAAEKVRQTQWDVTPEVLDFGSVTAGETGISSPLAVQVKNSGSTSLEITDARILGEDFQAFSLENEVMGTLIEPNEVVHLVILFAPPRLGTHTAKLELTSDAGSLTVPLQGTGSEETSETGDYTVVVLNSKGQELHVVDPVSCKASGGFLYGHLGRYDLYDLAVTSDGSRGIASTYGSKLFLIDFTNPMTPRVTETLDFESFREMDIAVTPNDRFAVVSGNNECCMGVVDFKANAIAATIDMESKLFSGARASAVAVAPDNQTVLVADWSQNRVYVMLINALGELTYRGISLETGRAPSNIAVSPDGETAIVICSEAEEATLLHIQSPGDVIKTGVLDLGWRKNASVVFSPDSRRAFIHSVESSPDILLVLDILGPGSARLSDYDVPLSCDATGTYYGVDTLDVSPDGAQVYVTNACSGNSVNHLSVVDAIAGMVIQEVSVGDVPVGVAVLNQGSGSSNDKNRPPECTITMDKTGGFPPLDVNFSARGEDADGNIASYTWDFGDDSTGTGPSVSHTYTLPGQYTVLLTVVDDQGGLASDAVLIRVGEEESYILPLSVTPASASIDISTPLTFAVLGDTPPYDIIAGSGSVVPTRVINSGGDFTFTPAEMGDVYVTITDDEGWDLKVRIRVTDQLGITPQEATVGRSGSVEFYSIGGQPPYTWRVTGGQLSRTQGAFTLYYAPDTEGVYQVSVRDNIAREITADINVVADEIVISPAVITAVMGADDEGKELVVTGGLPPYDWRATSGTIRSVGQGSEASYFTPQEAGTYYISVSDSKGRAAQTVVRVVNALRASPEEIHLNRGEVKTLHVTGGASPYLWRAAQGDFSSVQGPSVSWIAPEISGKHEIVVTDAFGMEARIRAVVSGGLMASPVLSVVTSGELVTLRAIQGTPPYIWPDGTGNNYYETAWDRFGRHEIQLKDGTGNVAVAYVEVVSDQVHVSPETADVDSTDAQTLKVIGGKAPYVWSFSGGTLNATEGKVVTWVSPERSGTYQITVTDSIGQSAAAHLNVYNNLTTAQEVSSDVKVISRIKINGAETRDNRVYANSEDDFDFGFEMKIPAGKTGDVLAAVVAEFNGIDPVVLFRTAEDYASLDPQGSLPVFRSVSSGTSETLEIPFFKGKLPGVATLTFFLGWTSQGELFLNNYSIFTVEIK